VARGKELRQGYEKPDEPYHSVQQACVQRADVDGPHIGMVLWRDITSFHYDRADKVGIELQAELRYGRSLDASRT